MIAFFDGDSFYENRKYISLTYEEKLKERRDRLAYYASACNKSLTNRELEKRLCLCLSLISNHVESGDYSLRDFVEYDKISLYERDDHYVADVHVHFIENGDIVGSLDKSDNDFKFKLKLGKSLSYYDVASFFQSAWREVTDHPKIKSISLDTWLLY